MKTLTQVVLSTFTMVGLVGLAVAAPNAGAPAPKAPAMVAPMPAKPMTPPPMATPPDELVKAGAAMAGTWKCKGTMNQMDGSSMPMVGTNKIAVDMDKWWIHESFSSPMGKATFRFESYMTFDGTSKMWKRVMLMSDGDMVTGTAKSGDPAKQDWDMTTDGPHGAGMFRDHADMSDMKTGVKLWGEMSMDKGKTWNKVYEETCKK